MSAPRNSTLLFASIAALLTAAIGMYWNELTPGSGVPVGTKAMLSVAVLAAAVSRAAGRTRMLPTILAIGLALPIGVLITFLIGMARDPSSNNLWPVAVLMIGVIGLLAAAIGAAIGSLILWVGAHKPPASRAM